MVAGAITARPGPATAAGGLSGQHQFQVLYEEVVRTKNEIVEALRRRVEPLSCEAAQQRVVDLVETQAGDALFLPENHEKRVALYVIVAMADEVFLRTPELWAWPGRSEWVHTPLEQRLFRSQMAGDRFYDSLDEVLSFRATRSVELLTMFLTALTLGFRGRYDDAVKPDEYRVNLIAVLERLRGVDAVAAAGDAVADANLFRHSARVVQERPSLPSVMNGITPILAVIALWLVAGFAVWQYATHDLSTALDVMLPAGQ